MLKWLKKTLAKLLQIEDNNILTLMNNKKMASTSSRGRELHQSHHK